MRLIDTETGFFVDFPDFSTAPPYAILSHTWDPKGEQTYQEVREIQERCKRSTRQMSNPPTHGPTTEPIHQSQPHPSKVVVGASDRHLGSQANGNDDPSPFPTPSIWDPMFGLSDKVRMACEVARRDGFRYIWIDSCCIDKTSSSELSEAINSMYNWYRDAQICYAFLSDVPSQSYSDDSRAYGSRFRSSRWFTRGWTLQELVAPRWVLFLSDEWTFLGTKDTLASVIEAITRIDSSVLRQEKSLDSASVAQRMSWAAARQTTRVEDQAYSLLGIFGINMPTLYGEGEQAFRRLQEEILKKIPDQTMFAWGEYGLPNLPSEPVVIPGLPQRSNKSRDRSQRSSFFAPTPWDFFDVDGGSTTRIFPASGDTIQHFKLPTSNVEYTPTPYGIRTHLPLLLLPKSSPLVPRDSDDSSDEKREWYLVILKCEHDIFPRRLLCRVCYTLSSESGPSAEILYVDQDYFFGRMLFALSPSDLEIPGTALEVKTVYLPHPERVGTIERSVGGSTGYDTLALTLPQWARIVLRERGYDASDVQRPGRAEVHPRSHSLTISTTSFRIRIQLECLLYDLNRYPGRSFTLAMAVRALVWILPVDQDTSNASQNAIPYASTIWSTHQRWPATLPQRQVTVGLPSGDEYHLHLGLDLVTLPRYDIRVDVVTKAQTVFQKSYDSQLGMTHKTIKLSLLGSVRRALQARGYTAHLEGPSQGDPCTHSLTIFNAEHTIVANFLHDLSNLDWDNKHTTFEKLAVVARVSLKASTSPPSPHDTLEAYQDGPHMVTWWDIPHPLDRLWKWKLGTKYVALTTAAGESLFLRLGLDLAWQSEYSLQIEIVDKQSSLLRAPTSTAEDQMKMRQLTGSHRCVNFTIPGHVKRALRLQGYDVLFLVGDDPNHPSLRLSNTKFAITVVYSHDLSSTGEWSQTLNLRARVNATSSVSDDSEMAHQDVCHTVEWKDTNGYGWDLHLDQKEVPLFPSSGGELTLRLGFTFMWYSEYCLDVEVKTHPPTLPEPRLAEGISEVEQARDPTDSEARLSIVRAADASDGANAPQHTAAGDGDKKDLRVPRPGAIAAWVPTLRAKVRKWGGRRGGGEPGNAAQGDRTSRRGIGL